MLSACLTYLLDVAFVKKIEYMRVGLEREP